MAGTPAYRLARKNIPVELAPVEVRVFALDLGEFDGTTARISVRCSAGTYLRGIAHDVGRELGCGAFLTACAALRRVSLPRARRSPWKRWKNWRARGALDQALIPASRLLPEIPNATVDALTAGQIRHGKDFRLSPFVERAGCEVRKSR